MIVGPRAARGLWGTQGGILVGNADHARGGDEYMAPNIVTYNALLNAWARSGTRCCGLKAEYYLDRMWELYKAGDTKVKPNDQSYNTVSWRELECNVMVCSEWDDGVLYRARPNNPYRT
jgi:hypothetical protein